jgi:hypothetical protein
MTAELRGKIRYLTHFTDKRNIDSIRQYGLCSLARLRRLGISIPAPGGSDLSHDLDVSKGLDEYVHLCLTYGHPMKKIATDDGRIKEVSHIGLDLRVLLFSGLLFAPGNSVKTGVDVYPLSTALEKGLIDFASLYDYYPWGTVEGNARRQVVDKYEILVPDIIPVDLLRF